MCTVASKGLIFCIGLVSAVALFSNTCALAQQTREQPARALAQQNAALPAEVATELVPPAGLRSYAAPSAVMLRSGSTSAVLKTLEVKRRFQPASLRTQPIIQIGQTRVNMTPVLANPSSLSNIATQLQHTPALAKVVATDMQVVEVQQGLVITQFLSYRVQPGVCADPAKRLQLSRSGVDCFVRQTQQARAADFADPRNPYFVADPATRAKALAAAESATRADSLPIAESIAQLRAMLRDPVQRASLEAEIGTAETVRWTSLDDASLEEEMVNTAEIEIEEVMFVPNREQASQVLGTSSLVPCVPGQTAAAPIVQSPEIALTLNANHTIDDQIYLTGFTLGRNYEWRKGVSVTVKMCWRGCARTYFSELYAGFSYGFGLRLPIRIGGVYRYHAGGSNGSASFTPSFATVNGSAADFASAGLAHNQLFDGKELVSEVSAHAGLNYHVPVFGSGGVNHDIDVDLTDKLPAPFTHGQFTPPMPGNHPPLVNKVFENIDLTGGIANFGVVGGKVFPVLQFDLDSKELQFRLKDNISGTQTTLSRSGDAYPLSVDARDRSSNFTIGDPVYKLGFSLTPGVYAHLFVNVKVWHKNWDWIVTFPELMLTLPPAGVDFSCHAGTVCSRNYSYSPKP